MSENLSEARKSIISKLRNENETLRNEIKRLISENDELEEEVERLNNKIKEAENRYLNMLIQNEQFVDTLDLINSIIRKSVET